MKGTGAWSSGLREVLQPGAQRSCWLRVLWGQHLPPPRWHNLRGEVLRGLSGKQAFKAPHKQPHIGLILSCASQNSLFPWSLGNYAQDVALWQGDPTVARFQAIVTFIVLSIVSPWDEFQLKEKHTDVLPSVHPGNWGSSLYYTDSKKKIFFNSSSPNCCYFQGPK